MYGSETESSVSNDGNAHRYLKGLAYIVKKWRACGCCCYWPEKECVRQADIKIRLANDTYAWTYTANFWQDLLSDYIFHVANGHPLLGIFFAHPLHPFNKCERFWVEFIKCTAVVPWTVLIKRAERLCGEADHWGAWEGIICPRLYGEAPDNPMKSNTGQKLDCLLIITVPTLIVYSLLRLLAIHTGKPESCLAKQCGSDRLCRLQCCILFWWSTMGTMGAFACFFLAVVPGWWNHDRRDSWRIEENYLLAIQAIIISWILWFFS